MQNLKPLIKAINKIHICKIANLNIRLFINREISMKNIVHKEHLTMKILDRYVNIYKTPQLLISIRAHPSK